MSTSPRTSRTSLPTTAPALPAPSPSPTSSSHARPPHQSGPIARRALEMLSTIPWYVQYPNRRLKRITYAYRNVDPAREGYERLAEEWKQCQSDGGEAPHSLLPYKQAADHNGNGKLDAKHAGLYWCIKTRRGDREPFETSPYGPLRYIAPLLDLIDVGECTLYLLNAYKTSSVYVVLVVVESARVEECGLDSLGLEPLDWRTNDFFRATSEGGQTVYRGSALAFVELFLMTPVTTSSQWRYVELPPNRVTRRHTLTASPTDKQGADEEKLAEKKQ